MEVNQSGGYYQFSRGGQIIVLIQPYNREKLWYAKDGENLHLIPDPNLLEALEKEYFDYKNIVDDEIQSCIKNTKDNCTSLCKISKTGDHCVIQF